jgi:hypothetical protein
MRLPVAASGPQGYWLSLGQRRPGWIKTQSGEFSIAGEGLCVGRDGGAPVTDDFPGESPWAFTGGVIKQVRVNVSGEPHLNLEREVQAMLMRE